MKPKITQEAAADIAWWKQNNPKVKAKIDELVRAALEDPKSGIGKPEPLKHHKSLWSRRITQEHRFVYYVDVENDLLIIVSCCYHYTNL